MSHYKPYPAYKDSGVEWIGRVPEHWKVVALKRLGTLKGGNGFPPDMQGRSGNELPFYKVGDLGRSTDGVTIGETEHSISRGDASSLGATVFPPGALAWAKIGAALSLNRRRILQSPSCLDNNMTGFTPDLSKASTTFCFRLLSSVDFSVHAKPGAIPSFSEGDQSELRVACPPADEQSAITTVLDLETARIDTLIAKKIRFIELLKEKITALASPPPDSPTLTWRRLAHVCDVISRPVTQQAGCTYTRLGLFNRGRGIFRRDDTDTEDMGDSDFFWIKSGDLILSGQFAWEGAVALAHDEHVRCVVSHRFPVIRGRGDQVLTEYLLAYFLTAHGDFVLDDCSRGSAGRNRPLNMNLLLDWKLPVPSMQVQRDVARLVQLERRIRSRVTKSITLLKERRSALITAAVTGQIDLREYA